MTLPLAVLVGEDALRGSGVPFAVVRPTALTEEPAGMPVELDQGDVVKVGVYITSKTDNIM